MYDAEDCIDGLREAQEILGETPSQRKYAELDVSPSVNTIKREFGSWNEAKEAAGLVGIKPGSAKGLDVGYFDSIDTTEKAYWLGFVMGDGSINEHPNGENFTIMLSEKDEEHLLLFRDAISSEHRVRHNDGCVVFSIGQSSFVDSLKEKGITSDKTFSGLLPELDEEYRASFVRGLYDADGCYLEKRGVNDRIYISGQLNRLERLERWLPVEGFTYDRGGHGRLYVYHNDSLKSLHDWMYPAGSDTEPMLSRKYFGPR